MTAKKLLLRANAYSALRLAAGLGTVLLIILHQKLPEKTLSLLPNPQVTHSLYGQQHNGEGSVAWLDEKNDIWRCINAPSYSYSCGYSLSFNSDPRKGLDFSEYEKLRIRLSHSGDSQRLRLFLRNYDDAYAKNDPEQLSKFMSVVIRATDFSSEATVALNEFSVGEWWIKMFDISREHSAPQLDNIATFGIDFVSPGSNVVHVQKVELVGEWVSRESFYFSVLAFWLVIVIWEGLSKFYTLYQKSKKEAAEFSQLVESYHALEERKNELETLSTTDALTGILNRAGINQFLDRLFGSDYEKSHLGLILFDIDHFKRINDTRGHDVGDRILVELAKIIDDNTRSTDLFGRWGGEEFLLICPQSGAIQLRELAEKLRILVSRHPFECDNPLSVTVSLGATSVGANEPFEVVFKRLDKALYQAKEQGRNCSIFV